MTVETIGNTSGCCSRVRSWGCIGWYLGPITYDLGLSFRSIFYFGFMIWVSLGLAIYTAVSFPVLIAFMAIFCVGLPLVYLDAEILIGLVRYFVLAVTYGLLETDKENVKNKVYLAIQNGMPLCSSFCNSNNRFARVKHIFKSLSFYKLFLHTLLISPICNWFFALSVILVAPPLYCMHHVFRYPFNSQYYKNKNECYGNSTRHDHKNHCQGWAVTNYGDCIALFLIGFVLLPLTLKLVINCGKLSKNICYYFLTNYYNPNIKRITTRYGPLNDEGNSNSNGKGSVQLNDQFNVQFLSGNNNYQSVKYNTDNGDNLVSV